MRKDYAITATAGGLAEQSRPAVAAIYDVLEDYSRKVGVHSTSLPRAGDGSGPDVSRVSPY